MPKAIHERSSIHGASQFMPFRAIHYGHARITYVNPSLSRVPILTSRFFIFARVKSVYISNILYYIISRSNQTALNKFCASKTAFISIAILFCPSFVLLCQFLFSSVRGIILAENERTLCKNHQIRILVDLVENQPSKTEVEV